MSPATPTHPASTPRALLIYNPTAGGRRAGRLRRVIRGLQAAGCGVELCPTQARGHAEALAATADPARHDLLLVAGGDGTINEALNGLRAGAPPLAIVPLGTANVLAAEIGLAPKPEAIVRAATCGVARPIDLGRANGRRFIMMAGVGFDARIVAQVSTRLKRRIGKLAYVWETLRQLLRYRPTRYTCRIDGQATYQAASIVIANGHYYAGRFVCAPQARLDDGCLHVVLFERSGGWNLLRYAVAVVTGQLGRLADVRVLPARTLEIDGPAGDPVQGDGDIVTTLPARFEIEPAALRLYYPPVDSPNTHPPTA